MPEHEPSFFLALDQGSHASKALVFNAGGHCFGAGERDIGTQRPGPDRVEHMAEEVLESLEAAIDEACRSAQLEPGRLSAAGLATQRSSIVCWDRQSGEALSPVLSWQDRRHATWLAAQGLDAERVHAVTGLVVSPHYGASKLRWCLDELDEVARANEAGRLCFGPLASYLLSSLVEGRPCLADPANASRTLLYDLERHDWSAEMMSAFGIPRDALPACVSSRHDFGRLRIGAARVPLKVMTGDQSAALFAAGTPRDDTLFVNIGTGAFVQRVCEGRPPPAPGLLHGVAWVDEEGSLGVLEGTVNGAAAAIEWLANERGEDARSLVARADEWLAAVSEPPLFSNGVGGLGSPFWIADYPVGFSEAAGIEQETVAVLESIVFLLQANIDALERAFPDRPPTRIRVSGGLSQLDGLCQRLADLSGLVVERPGETEATARGVGFLLGVETGSVDVDGCFELGRSAGLEERYGRWLEGVRAEVARRGDHANPAERPGNGSR
jgi:glycerol kinase